FESELETIRVSRIREELGCQFRVVRRGLELVVVADEVGRKHLAMEGGATTAELIVDDRLNVDRVEQSLAYLLVFQGRVAEFTEREVEHPVGVARDQLDTRVLVDDIVGSDRNICHEVDASALEGSNLSSFVR